MTSRTLTLEGARDICLETLFTAHESLRALRAKGPQSIHAVRPYDASTKTATPISESILTHLQKTGLPAVVWDKRLGVVPLAKDPAYLLAFDDIDGTDNFVRGNDVLPYCTVAALYDQANPSYKDVLAAAIVEHPTRTVWEAMRGRGVRMGEYDRLAPKEKYVGARTVRTSGKKDLDRATAVGIELYNSPAAAAQLAAIFDQSWVRNFCSSALHLAGLSSGMFDAWINPTHQAHELGAGYLLVKEAGGFISDFSGRALDGRRYIFTEKLPIIAAATPELGNILLRRIASK